MPKPDLIDQQNIRTTEFVFSEVQGTGSAKVLFVKVVAAGKEMLSLANLDDIKALLSQRETEALDKQLKRLGEAAGIMNLCETDLDTILIWVKNNRWSLIAPKGKDTHNTKDSER